MLSISMTGSFFWLLNPTNLIPYLSVYSVFPLHLQSTCSQCYKNKRWREAVTLISSLTYSLKAGAAQREKCFFLRISPEDGLCDAWLQKRATSYTLWGSMITRSRRCRNVKSGLDWTEIDYCPLLKCMAKLHALRLSFLPSGLILDSVQASPYRGRSCSQPPTPSIVRDKYCLASSTFHARLPPPVPWPAKVWRQE